jgi:PHP family Zn ribbon phosphoesterase
MRFRADLHIHSCLSPCGSLYSSPAAIAAAARDRGLDLIALTDHNSSLNCPAFLEACDREGIRGLCGMEATTAEEAHCLCLFPSLEDALDYSAFIDSRMTKVPLDPRRMGDQVVTDLAENITGTVDHLLIAATDLSLENMEGEVHRRGGLFIPAHVDRRAFSLTSQLGFIPRGTYDALEWYDPENPRRSEFGGYPHLFNSDAHEPEAVGRRHFVFEAESPDFSGLAGWLAAEKSRLTR